MTVYVVAQLTIHDRARYDRYAAGFMAVLDRYGGRLLAADERPEVVEGDWGHRKVVLIEFADRESADRWSTSPEYREIAVDRIAATDGVVLFVRGVR
jgi:uncharacterized protein (DUF1330 family)